MICYQAMKLLKIKKTANTDGKNSFKVIFDKEVQRGKVSCNKEAWIRQKLEYYFGIGEKKKQLVDQLTKMISHK